MAATRLVTDARPDHEEHQAIAERHIVRSSELLAKQKAIIAELNRCGHDTKDAKVYQPQTPIAQRPRTREKAGCGANPDTPYTALALKQVSTAATIMEVPYTVFI